MRLFLCLVFFFAACQHHRPSPEPSYGPVTLAPGSESTYGQCRDDYTRVLPERIDLSRVISADYDNQMRGRLILDPEGNGQFVGCLLSRSSVCEPPNVVHTYESGLEVCVHTQRCCALVK